MLPRIRWYVERLPKRLWFRATVFCLIGVVSALAARWLAPLISEEVAEKFGADSVGSLLTVIASSMLTITVFSLTTLVQARRSASQGATPRTASLLVEDTVAQHALSTFLGAFLFSLVGLISLQAGLYGSSGRVVLFIATLGLILYIVFTLVRWINHLGALGRIDHTIHRVEKVASDAMEEYRDLPCLGAREYHDPPASAVEVCIERIGYVRRIDLAALQALAEEYDTQIYAAQRPGGFCDPSRPLAYVTNGELATNGFEPKSGNGFAENLRSAFEIGPDRSYEQDPRFGLIVLAEIGARALSSAVNDSGTAIQSLQAGMRLLSVAADAKGTEEAKYDRVFVRRLEPEDLFDDSFLPIARDGASRLEVMIRLQKALRALASQGDAEFAEAARKASRAASARGMAALTFPDDRERLAQVSTDRW
ncbi:MAG TPA: DUF2254 domain-containing protein [Pirellulaceae bacterium]|jgi:uncharacterized membrane protein|nr:DUF2254 domain-containing protein [Pirellulaceae bacterium]